MEKRVVLCVDRQSLRDPALVGLPEESFEALFWLECSTGAQQCRDAAAKISSVEEVWVISCDDMELINVAAAVKRDDPNKKVYVACRDGGGSMASRAKNAGVDGLWSEAQFLRRFFQVKEAFAYGGGRRPDAVAVPEAAGARPDSQGGVEMQESARGRSGGPARVLRSDASRTGERNAEREKTATTIAVVAGSGGCGKSTIAATLAGLASKAGLATIVVDADLQFGDMDRMLGSKEPLRIEDALASPVCFDRLRDEARKGAALVAAPRRVELSEEIAPRIPSVLDRVASLCDVVVVNTGAMWTDVQACVLDAADAAVFLMDSRPSSLHATLRAVELCARLGLATSSFSFVVNRHGKSSLLSAVDASCSLRGAHAVEFPDGGRDVDELLGSGYLSELMESGNALVPHVGQMLEKLLPEEKREAVRRLAPMSARRRKSFFRRAG